LESPAGVGYSSNLDTKFEYTDEITASDSLNAVLSFFQLYPEYSKSKFFIAG
jgi:carboxypeptidase C (cathepsin A)